MSDDHLTGSDDSIGINSDNTVGIIEVPYIKTNETRSCKFTTSKLVEWAEAVDEAYDGVVNVVFTPKRPLVATEVIPNDDNTARVGVSVAPRLPPKDLEDDND